MNIYQKYILPRLINFVMQDEKNEKKRAQLIPRASGIVLEIGFGSGLNLPFYGKEVSKLYAIDPSKELWEFSKERVSKAPFPVEFINASAERIPLADNSVDAAITTWTLCSIPNPEQALREVQRVLKAAGKLLFIEHGLSPEKRISKWQIRFNPFWKRIAGGCHLDRKIDDLITNAGFKIVELKKTPGKAALSYEYKGVARIGEDNKQNRKID